LTGEARKLRTAIATFEEQIRTYEAQLSVSPDDRQLASLLQTARQNLAIPRDDLAAQIRLLELELKDATSAAASAALSVERLTPLYRQGTVPLSPITKAHRDFQAAQLRVQRARTLLELYRKVGSPDDQKQDRPAPKDPPNVPAEQDKPADGRK
jgi:multidrug resistance efflux pump